MFMFLTLLSLAFLLVTLTGIAAAPPNAGTSSGYALTFQGENDFASVRKSYSEVTDKSKFPSPTGGSTFSAWIKTAHPKTTQATLMMMGEIGTFIPSFRVDCGGGEFVQLVFTSPTFVIVSTGIDYNDFFGQWHHVAFTFQNVVAGDGTVMSSVLKLYFDGQEIYNDAGVGESLAWDDSPSLALGTCVDMTGSLPNLYLQQEHFHGSIDDVAIYNRALTTAEIGSTWNRTLTGSEPDLVIFYNFDGSFGDDHAENLGSSGSDFDLLYGASFQGTTHLGPSTVVGLDGGLANSPFCRYPGGPLVYCEPMRKPVVTGSDSPVLQGNFNDVVATVNPLDLSTVITLPGSDDANRVVTFSLLSTPAPAVGALSGLDTAAGTVTYTWPAASTGSITFDYQVSAGSPAAETSSAQVRVIFSAAPVAFDLHVMVVEDSFSDFVLGSYDPSGLGLSWILTSLPLFGSIVELDGANRIVSTVSAADLPKTLRSNHLRYQSAPAQVAPVAFSYHVANSVGQSSPSYDGAIAFTEIPNLPVTVASSREVAASTDVTINLEISDSDSSLVTLLVTSVPLNGKLFLANTDGSKGEEITVGFRPFNIMAPSSQYASEVLEFSSYWSDPSFDEFGKRPWHATQVLGEMNAPFVYGDSPLTAAFATRDASRATCDAQIFSGDTFSVRGDADFTVPPVTLNNTWEDVSDIFRGRPKSEWVTDFCWDPRASFDAHGYSEFFTLRFDEPVYLQSIQIGENRAVASLISIEAYDRDTKLWFAFWTGEADQEIDTYYKDTRQYRVNSPAICQPPFATDIIRFKVDTITIIGWNEFDYVKIFGSAKIAPGILPAGTKSVIYEAPDVFTSVDSFTYSGTDCGYRVDRVSAEQVVFVAPVGNSVTAFPVAAAPLDILVTTGGASSSLVGDLKLTNHTLEIVEQVVYNGVPTCTVVVDEMTKETRVDFSWTHVESDSENYECVYLATSNEDGTVSKGSIGYTLNPEIVFKRSDLDYTISECNKADVRELVYRWSASAEATGIGGVSLPKSLDEPCEIVPYSSSAGIIIIALALCGFSVCSLFSILLFKYKKHPVIKASQPLFCISFSSGCALICLQLILFLGDISDLVCALRAWVFTLCFVGAFGSLFIKVWRVYSIFRYTSKMKKVKLTNRGTISIMLTLIGVAIVILSLGQIIAPSKVVTREVEFSSNRFYSSKVCESSSDQFQLLDNAYKVVLVCVGCYLSWIIRNVDSAFSESKQIMFAIYQVAVYGVLASLIVSANARTSTTLMVTSFCCVFGAICCVACVLLPKFVLIKSGAADNGIIGGNSSSTTTKTSNNASNSMNSSITTSAVHLPSASSMETAKVHPI